MNYAISLLFIHKKMIEHILSKYNESECLRNFLVKRICLALFLLIVLTVSAHGDCSDLTYSIASPTSDYSITVCSPNPSYFKATISNTNSAGSDCAASSLKATVTLPAGFKYSTGSTTIQSPSGGSTVSTVDPTINGQTLTWDLGTTPGNLVPGSSVAITFGVTADCEADPASGQPINLAIDYTMGVHKTPSAVSTPKTILIKRGQLNVEKVPITTPNSGSVITAAVGDYVEWNLMVKNAAAGTAAGPLYNIKLSDQFDSGLEFVSITAPAGDTSTVITPGNPATVAIPGPINPGVTWTGVIKARVVGCSNLVETVTGSWGCNPQAACTDSVFSFSTKGSIKIILWKPDLDIAPVYASAGSYSIPYCSYQTVTLHYANTGGGSARGVHVHMGNLPSQFLVSSLPGSTISPDPDHPTDPSKFILTIGDIAAGTAGDAQFKLMMKSDGSACEATGGVLTMEPDYTDDCGNPWAPPLELIYFSVDSSKKPTLTLTKTPTSSGSNILKPNDASTEASFDLQVEFKSNGGGCTASLPVDIIDTYPEGFSVVDSAGGVVDATAQTITWPSTDAAQTLSDGVVWKKTIKLGPQSSTCDMCTGTYSTLLSARPPAGVDCCGCTLSGSASADIIVNGPTLTVSKTASGLANDYLILSDVSQIAIFDLTVDYKKNDGCSDTLDAEIVDAYPAGFTVVDAAGGTVDATANTITWSQTGGNALVSGSPWTKTVKIQPPASSCGESFTNTLTATEVNSGPVCPLLSDSKSVKIMVNCVGGTGSVFTTEKSSTSVDTCSDIGYTTTYTFQSAVTDWNGYKFGVHFTGPQEFPSGGAPASFSVYDADNSQIGSTKKSYLSPEAVSGVPELELGSAGLDLPQLPQNGKLVVTYTLYTTGPGDIIDWSDLMVSGGQTYHQGMPVKIAPSGPPSFSVKLNLPPVIETGGETDVTIVVTQEDNYYAYGLMRITLDTANYEYVAGSASINGFEGTGLAASAEPDLSTGKPIWNLGDKVRTTSGKGTISFKIKKACGTAPTAKAILDYKDKCGGTYQKVGSDEKPVLVGTARLILTLTPETIYATEDTQTWRIYVTNTGTGAAYNTIVTDTLGANLQYVPGTARVNGAALEPLDPFSSTLQWKFDSIEIKKTRIIEFQTRLTGCSPGPNTAVAQWGPDYSNPCSTTSTGTSRVVLNTNYQFAVQLVTAPIDPCGDRSGPFSLTITNSGGVHAYGVTATQRLPIGLGIVGGIDNGITYEGSHQPLLGFNPNNGEISLDFTGQDWAPGDYCQISYYLQSDTTPPCKFDPTAATTSASVDYHTPCGSSKAEALNDIPLSSANSQLELTKVQIHPSSSVVDKDTEVSWKITVKNPSGNLWTARNVVVKDLLPSNTQFLADPITPGYEPTTTPYSGDGTSGNELTWNLGDMAVGSEKSIIVNAKVTICDAGTNKATVTWGCCEDTKHTSASTPINVDLKTKPTFGIAQTSNVNVCSGTISLTISNTGATANGPFTLADTIPEGFVYDGISSAAINGNPITMPAPTSTGTSPVTLTWDLTGLFADNKMLKDDTLTITFKISDDGYHCGSSATNPRNAAVFSGKDLCGYSVTRTVSSPVTILAPNLVVTKTPHDQKAVVGEKNSWTLTVTNTGTADAENVVVTDTFGSAYQISDPERDVPDGIIQPGGTGTVVTWSLPTLAGNGGSWTKTVKATLTSTSSDMNNYVHAEGKCSSGCVYGSDDDTAAATYVTITKSTTTSTLTIGDKVDFIITASLLGTGVPFTNVKIKDTLPKGLDVVGSDYYSCSDSASCSGIVATKQASGEDQLITWSLPDFVGAKTVQITLHAVVKDKVDGVSYNKDGDTLVNKVDLVRTVYGQTSTDSDEESVSLVEPKLKLEKAVDISTVNPITHNPMYHPGDTVTYTITIYHDADSHATAYQVDVQDTLPTGMTYVPGSIRIINGPAGTADDTSADAKLLKWHFDQVEQTWVSGNPIRLSYQAKIDDDVQTGILNNKVIADYYTKLSPTDNPERRLEPELAASKTINAAVACIGDKVWEDKNGNGQQDAGEPGIAGVTVTLFKSDGTQVGTPFTTLADGAYSFSHLEPGDYYLRFSPPASSSYVFTPKGIGAASTDSNAENAAGATYGQTDTRTLSIGETISCDSTVDAGLYIPTCLNGLAWVDTNGNGIKDGSESGLQGVSVTLYRKNDFSTSYVQKGVTSTDSSGAYSFSSLQPGTYYVVFAKPAGTNYLFIIKSAGSDTQVLNSAGKTSTVVLTSGQACDGTLKAGLYQPASLGDFVWHDRNANGIQDTGEEGISGATVILRKSGVTTSTATTLADGKYKFTGLVPGSYTVTFAKPSGYNSFSPKGIGDADKNSDADTTSGQTVAITLLSGQEDLTWDAGVYKYASLGDFVWHDRNANGIQETSEEGVAGVTVTLYKSGVASGTTTTSTTGAYLFSNLVPGSYSVKFDKPAGYDSFSPMDQGADNAKDSDADTTSGQTATTTLQSGDSDRTWDAGVYKYASLGDFVWHDRNANGIQDAGEEGIADVTVTLYKSGVASGTITTGPDGNYKFTGLVPGVYSVKFEKPAGYDSFSPVDKGNDNTVDSDADATSGQTATTTLQSGDNDLTWDAGVYKYTCLNGLAWIDTNGNGIKDGSESGLQDVSVTLYRKDDFGGADVQKAVTSTDPSGAYSFSSLQPGTYYVKFTKPSGTGYLFIIKSAGSETQVLDASGKTSTVVLTSGQACDGTLKAGLYLPASLGDFVWQDKNANGIQETGEEGIAGANVILHKPDGSTSTATTLADGKYQFTGLVPGSYYVVFTKPAGYDSFSPKDIGDAGRNSDADTTSGQTVAITLLSGQEDLTWDAGVYKYASLGDFVWHDRNANGIQETGEEGVAGVTVTLYKSGVASGTTTTGTDGYYLFSNLVPGSYSVKFEKPAEYNSFSPMGQGGDNAKDSDADIVDGKTASTTLQSGDSDLKLDAGIYKYASLGDFVWHDRNANGIQDAGEEGIADVTVTLYKSGVASGTTKTGLDGSYQFTGLVPGSYSVDFDKPAGYDSFSPVDQGGDNAKDSDADIADGKTASTALQSGSVDNSWDAGAYKYTCLNGLAWVDTNGNGNKDLGEDELQDVSVTLYRMDDLGGADVQKAVTSTDSNGAYSFSNLQPGTYYVVFAKPTGTNYLFIIKSTGSETQVLDSSGKTSTVVLTSGQSNCDGTLKAGLYLPASLGDFVWQDKNANGIQETGEEGIAGANVILHKPDGSTSTATTLADGKYQFTGLVPGSYYVVFTKPAGYDSFSPKGIGDAGRNSDADTTSGQTVAITLLSGQEDLTWDAGVYKYASLGDFVWHDRNANGIQETGEEGVAGVTVTLYKSGVASGTTITGTDGYYQFNGMVPGSYSVKFDKPAEYNSFSPMGQGGDNAKDSDADIVDGKTASTTLQSGDSDLKLDAGIYKYASLGDFVWHDRNANGIQDAGEEGIADVTVTLYKSGVASGTTKTGLDGSYQFTGLVPGSYSVDFDKPAGYDSFSPAGQGGDDGKDSDADIADGQTDPITLQSGVHDPTWDAGLCKDVCLGGLAWVDTNGNGIKDSSENGLQGVSVILYRMDDLGGADVQKAVTSTDSNGAYSFGDLQPGTYYVVFAKPTGTNYLFITKSTGSETQVQNQDGKTGTVALTSGQPCDGTLKAGLYLPASLGDFVWHDRNANGIQDSGEEGIADVTVTLHKSGVASGTTKTGLDGSYQFTSLVPGSYSVEFTKPAEYDSFSPVDQGGDNAADSDADTAGGQTASTTLQSGDSDITLDAGLYKYTCLSGLAWVDSNGNGIKDSGENAREGVFVTLYRKDDFGGADVQKAVTSTDSDGAYSFSDLQPGTYYVVFAKPTGTNYLFIIKSTGSDTQVQDSAGQTGTVDLTSGQPDCDGTLKAGLYLPASLGDFVWHDKNANGIQDSGEEGIEGATVTLHKPDGTASITTTGTGGNYQFTNLVPGSYYVVFDKPTGYDSFSPEDQGGDDAADSNADISSGETAAITLLSGQDDLTWDAGVYKYASLGDFVWHDKNANGIQDAGEEGIAGVTVTLHKPGGATSIATTGTDGSYKFTGLVPGSYSVAFTKPAGYDSFSPEDQGGDDAADSNADISSGETAPTTLQSGESNLKLDAGIYKLASLGDFVWHDNNANGVQDAGEEGIAGVTVTLYMSDALAGTTTTDASGYYQFPGLVPGSYSLEFAKPAKYDSFSPKDQGGDDGKDSDADTASGKSASTALQSGVNDPTWDAGLYKYTCSNGLAWVDTNGNGIKDSSESGLEGVSVSLYRMDDFGGADVLKATASTDANGAYSFSDLQAGTYYVVFAKPTGTNYLFIIEQSGSDTQVLNSDGKTSTIILTSGQTTCDGTLKAGLYLPASLGDFVWHDKNNNGIQDSGEEGIADVTVTLYKSGVAISTATTLADGKYQFTDLAPGSYSVAFTKPAGYDSFSPKDQGGDKAVDSNADSNGLTDTISLASEEINLNIDAGLNRKASLGDFFWEDLNANGIQEPGEIGIPTATVLLFDASGNKLGETTTDANGFYEFTDLNPGDYFVQFVLPAGFSWSPNGMGDAAHNSDAGLDGKTDIISLISGENDLELDAGAFRTASIGDYVWTDENANGIQEQGEKGLAAVKVELYSTSGTKIAETFTDANGWYQFTGLRPGDYYLIFYAPEGHYQSPADLGGNDALDSDTGTDGKTAITSLASGENDISWDAGYYRLSALGGFVWEDLNADGIYQPGEGSAISGVTVNLYHSDGTLVGTTTTDANGQYLFQDLVPGDYYLTFQSPQGYSFSPANQGGNDNMDSDPAVNGRTETTTLLSGESDLTWWAGLNRKSSLGDYVWNDADANGLQDAGEAGISGVSVQLYDAAGNLIQTTSTDGNGYYSFTDLQPGSYSLKFLAPAGLRFSPKDAGDNLLDSDTNDAGLTGPIVLVSGQNDPSWDAGLFGLASLGDTVWLDINGNGIQDQNEPGVAGVIANLYRSDDTLVKTTSTDTNGYYDFTELDAGTYYLIFSPPQGYDFTASGQGSDPAKDSNADSSGRTAPVALTTGKNDPTIDAGVTMPASLGDYVWYDSNADGVFQSGEAGIPNVLVELYRSDGTLAASATTDGSGHYTFVQLAPGDYYLLFHAPDGYHFSPMNQGADDNQDSDAASNGRTDVFNLPSGANDMSRDAGLNEKVALGDFVWVDYNKDGIQDDGEPGIVDIKVTLYSQDGKEIGSTNTDENGKYLFEVSPGQYYLIFGLPDGFDFTKQNQGTDTDKDSNPDSSGKTAVFQIDPGQADLSLDAGVYTKQDPIVTTALGDFVWVDYNKDGIQDDGEPGIVDIKVTLYSQDGKEIGSTTTDENGKYLFKVSPGQYYLIFGLPDGFVFTGQNQGTNTDKDSNPDSSGKTAVFQIDLGETDLSLDAGVYAKQDPIVIKPILNLTKTCLTKSVASGGEAVFKITFANEGNIDLHNVVLTEFYPKGSIFLSASISPDQGNNSVWTIGTLKQSESGQIEVTLLMPERANLTFTMQQSVKGEGFVRVHNDMDTRPEPYTITNQARITSSETGPISTSASVTLVEKPGTVISVRESGSGNYQTEHISRLITENRTTESITSLSATHRPTSFKLPANRSIVYADRWTEDIRGKNEISKASVRESYRYATSIERNQSLKMSENGSTMKTDVKFEGAGHIGVLKKETDVVKPFEKPVFESREDYAGRFNISEYADEYGENVMTNRSVQGNGTVSTAKTVRSSQGTYEYGTGSYNVEEEVVSGSSYMAKDIKLVYEPSSFNYTPQLAVNQSMKWNEGMYTKSGNAKLRGGGLTNKSCIAGVDSTLKSYIGQQFSSLDSMNKTTEIKGLSEMNTEAQFKGQARLRTLLESGKDGAGTRLSGNSSGVEDSSDRIDMDEQYAGEFIISRKTALTGVSRYEVPHITVWKDGRLTYGLLKKVNATIAEYTITMINDGSRSLGPIYVRDTFPAGTQFIDASLRPAEQTAEYANWTIVSLGIGSTNTIKLRLNVTEEAGDLVNVVEATGWHSSGQTVGRNISAMERAGLPCCQPQLLAEKTATLDPADPTLIHYKISIKNTASSPMAVQVVDYMPPDLSIITSSQTPSDYSADQTTWTLTAVPPGEVETISYSAQAKRNGAYTNQAHLQAYSLDGSGSASADVSASVVVGGSAQPAKTQRYGGDWQPPADEFGLTTTDEGMGTLEDF